MLKISCFCQSDLIGKFDNSGRLHLKIKVSERLPVWDSLHRPETNPLPPGRSVARDSLRRLVSNSRTFLKHLHFATERITEKIEPTRISFAAISWPENPRRINFATSPRRPSSVRGRPSLMSRSRAAARPALTWSMMASRSNSATAKSTFLWSRLAELLSLVSIPCDEKRASCGEFLPRRSILRTLHRASGHLSRFGRGIATVTFGTNRVSNEVI